MFDFLKKAFSKPDQEPAPTVTAPAKPAAPRAAPTPQPASVPKPAPAPSAAPPATAPVTGDVVKIAIIDIVPKLPAELAPLPGANATGSISIPVNTVIAQLAAGAVRVRFAQIREAAPNGVFPTAPELGEKMIDLPLPKILGMINPALLTRRAGQKQMELSDDVGGVFGPKGKPASTGHAVAAPVAPGTAAPVTPKPEPVAPAPAPVVPAPASIPAPASVVAAAPIAAPVIPVAPAPAPAPVQQKPPTSIASPPSAPKMPASSPLPFATQKPVAPPSAPSPLPFAQKPAAASPPPSAAPLPFATQKPAVAPTPAPAPTPTPAAAPVGGGLILQLSAISESWPEPVRQEITQNNLTGASVALPMDRIDTGMKSGRVAFTWGELSQWLDGGAVPPSANKDMLLELPLKVIIPLFMAKRQVNTAQKKVSIGENIPNLFAGLTVAPVQAPPAETSAPVAPLETAPVPAPVAVAPSVAANVLGEIFGQPAKAEWSPQEIAARVKTLPGISAALIAMSDGLLVAGEAPAPLKSDTLAAFLPQMFSRMNHYSAETQLGAVNTLTIQTEEWQCAIFKAGTLLLAVLNKPGEPLPHAVLQKVAGELAKRTS